MSRVTLTLIFHIFHPSRKEGPCSLRMFTVNIHSLVNEIDRGLWAQYDCSVGKTRTLHIAYITTGRRIISKLDSPGWNAFRSSSVASSSLVSWSVVVKYHSHDTVYCWCLGYPSIDGCIRRGYVQRFSYVNVQFNSFDLKIWCI